MRRTRVRKCKLFREKYGITCAELGKHCGVSAQRIHELETKEGSVTPATVQKICCGLQSVMQNRQKRIYEFWADMKKHSGTVMDYVEETTYEL